MFKTRLIHTAAAFLMVTAPSFAIETRANQTKETVSGNKAAMTKLKTLLSLARDPQRIDVRTIQAEFEAVMEPDSCDPRQWSCRWGAEVLQDAPSVTNLDLPNIKSGKYQSGGNMLMEFPRSTCLHLEDISNLIRTRPTFSSEPPAVQAFTKENEPLPREQIASFDRIPGMNNQIRVTAWIDNGCLTRVEVNALIKAKD
ncbi:hypothetical protein [Massilia sp. YMA4]|uniref:hypothetical protein n=1 Tax=Massilia sp. YMA4 TaxID=1593482 RepID=UPI001583B6CF|nr:hypothetical protein [Massilia sp. YMA4]